MKKSSVNYERLFIVTLFVAIVLSLALALTIVSLRASSKLLYTLKIPQPGTNLELVKDQLGVKLLETADVDYMEFRGSIKDTAFLQDKKWFKFGVSAPPCRGIEVYTDTNNVIVFVTWQQL